MKNLRRILPLCLSAIFLGLPLCSCAKSYSMNSEDDPFYETLTPSDQHSENQPLDPFIPSDPETPNKPEEPIEPEAPTEPEAPNESETTNKPETPTEPEAPAAPGEIDERAAYIEILTNGLNVRSGPGTGYASYGTVEKGVLLDFEGKTGEWYETRYRGKRAYVSAGKSYSKLFFLQTGSSETEAIIKEGLSCLGTDYVYGAVRYHDGKGNRLKGFTAAAFDCSSLMQYIFYMGAGKKLSLTTRTQILQGKSIKKSMIQRGDLLFFTNASRYNNTGIERVGHVGLYLGENYILHTASDYAKIEQISVKRWSYFLEARRV